MRSIVIAFVAGCGRIAFDPIATPPDATPSGRWTSVWAGGAHTCAIRDDGAAWCWGGQSTNELGTGAPLGIGAMPAQLPGLWRTIANYFQTGCGIARDGTLWCWGDGTLGTTGDGVFASHVLPVQIDTGTDWSQLTMGNTHACALETNGALWCWGNSIYYQFDSTSAEYASKHQIAGTFLAVSASAEHTCVIRSDRSLACIGTDNAGELGQGSPALLLTTYTAIGTDTDWARLAVGSTTACAIKTNGSLWCWGKNDYGNLGFGNRTSNSVPARVGTDTDWVDVQVSDDHTCASKPDESLWCWGGSARGQLGGTRTTDALTPTLVAHGPAWSAPGGDTCYIDDRGALWCTGVNDRAQVMWPPGSSATPRMCDGGWTTIFGSRFHLCGIDAAGTMSCWGANGYGELGDGSERDRQLPVQVSGGPWQTAGLTATQTFAVVGRQLYQWGAGTDTPQLFDGSASWAALAGGGAHACGIAGGTTYCWGNNAHGQLGTGDMMNRATPAPLLVPFLMLASGDAHTCGFSTIAVECWGRNDNGQVGDGGTADTSMPTAITDGGQPVGQASKIVAGDLFSCALYPDHSLWCWGNNGAGQFGNGNTGASSTPVPAGMTTDWADVAAGDFHMCGIKIDGSLWCWGHGDEGQIGIGPIPPVSSTPIQVGTATDWKSVVGLHHSTCALRQDGTRWCFGAAYDGQYGDGKGWLDDFVLITIPGA